MNKVYTIIVAFLLSLNIFAQSPDKISYQAVIRNSENNLVANQQVGMQISILQGTDANSATSVYSETHISNTNANGLVSIEIGTGSSPDNFSAIDWGNGTYFIKTETDIEGGTNYSITGVSQLLSVPFALFAKEAGNVPNIEGLATQKALEDSVNTLRAAIVNECARLAIVLGADISTLLDNEIYSVEELILAGVEISELISYGVSTLDLLEAGANFNGLSGSFVDERDGQAYNWIGIGNQIWMAENLNFYTELNSYYYNNDSLSYSNDYGRLYSGKIDFNSVSPNGWHVPDSSEFAQLIEYVGGDGGNTANALKEIGTDYWLNSNGTNINGFSARGSGMGEKFSGDPESSKLKEMGCFWTTEEVFGPPNYDVLMYYRCIWLNSSPDQNDTMWQWGEIDGADGTMPIQYFSIRCIMD